MKIGIVLDNKVNKWAMQRFEPLKDEFDITVFVGERNDYDTGSINLKIQHLNHKEEISLALRDPSTAYTRFLTAPYKKMDYYYFSLNKYLHGFDMVYACDLSRSAYTLASLKKKYGFKILLSWWENIPYKSIFDNKVTFQKKLIMDNVDLFLPFTERSRENLLMEGIPENKINVIYPGLELQRFTPGEKPRGLMKKYRIPESAFVILYVGKLVSLKGVHNLIYAAKILKDRGIKDFVFAIAGKGAQKENMERLIEESKTKEYFRFLDFVSYDEIPEIYRMADTFVLPSYPAMGWQEQFGMVLIEAMASGIPVISTQSGTIPEVVGDAGILVPAGDYNELADALIRLINDRSLRDMLKQKGMERVKELFDTNKISAELRTVLQGIT